MLFRIFIIRMTTVTIYLTPALDGVTSEVGYFYENQWIKLINMSPSVAGAITGGVVFNGVPDLPLYLFIPSQTIGGITYEEAISNGWAKTASTFTDNITLVEVQEPNGNGEPPSPIDIKSIAIPGIVGVVLMVLLRG